MTEGKPVDEESPLSAAARVQLNARRAKCRERLREIALDSGGAPLAAMIGEAKLLRGTLLLGTGSALGAPSTALVPAAVSVELLHLASLVHDDMIDDARERRGVAAFHVAAGRPRALVVGDLLIVAAFDALRELAGVVRGDVFASAIGALTTSARSCCLGQLDELDPERSVRSEAEYLDVAARKTGSLFALSASLGAVLGEADEDDVAALAAFGTQLGTAYQVRDDIRDVDEDAPAPRYAPDITMYLRVVTAVGRALDDVSPRCRPALRLLLDTMLPVPAGSSALEMSTVGGRL